MFFRTIICQPLDDYSMELGCEYHMLPPETASVHEIVKNSKWNLFTEFSLKIQIVRHVAPYYYVSQGNILILSLSF